MSRAAILCMVLFAVFCGQGCDRDGADRMATYKWLRPTSIGKAKWDRPSSEISVRRDEKTGDLLLRKYSDVYRLPVGGTKLREAAVVDWTNCTGPIATDTARYPVSHEHSHSGRDSAKFHLNVDDRRNSYVLKYQGNKIETKGDAPYRAVYSPDHQYIAVLSVNGPPRSVGGIIFGGELTYNGPFYHEIFRLSDGSRVGDAVVLEGSRNAEYVMLAWSKDGKQIVYFDWNYKYVWIIDTPSGPAPPEPVKPKPEPKPPVPVTFSELTNIRSADTNGDGVVDELRVDLVGSFVTEEELVVSGL